MNFSIYEFVVFYLFIPFVFHKDLGIHEFKKGFYLDVYLNLKRMVEKSQSIRCDKL